MFKSETQNPLSDIEWTTLWMAVRYAWDRETIAAVTLPEMIISNYYYRLSTMQKKALYDDLFREFNIFGDDIYNKGALNKKSWLKFFMAIGGSETQTVVTDVTGKEHNGFYVDDRFYPLESYLQKPYGETYLPEENILNI
jgi:hypothetical protein